jgi:hypothetical protein
MYLNDIFFFWFKFWAIDGTGSYIWISNSNIVILHLHRNQTSYNNSRVIFGARWLCYLIWYTIHTICIKLKRSTLMSDCHGAKDSSAVHGF